MNDEDPRGGAGSTDKGDSVRNYIDNLQTTPHGDHVIRGMVKPGETPDGLMFAHVGDCTRWVFIPASAIQSISDVGRASCLGHSHAIAEIQLKDPESALEKAFSGVASLHRAKLAQTLAAAAQPSDQTGCPPGYHLGRDQWGNLTCLPGP